MFFDFFLYKCGHIYYSCSIFSWDSVESWGRNYILSVSSWIWKTQLQVINLWNGRWRVFEKHTLPITNFRKNCFLERLDGNSEHRASVYWYLVLEITDFHYSFPIIRISVFPGFPISCFRIFKFWDPSTSFEITEIYISIVSYSHKILTNRNSSSHEPWFQKPRYLPVTD